MTVNGECKECVQGAVVRIASEPKKAPRGGYIFRGLEITADEHTNRVFLMFPEFAGQDLYDFPLLCWEDARIAAFNLQFNNRLDDGSVIYTVMPESHLLLEPYRLVSVTEAVEAATCVRSADMRYRVGSQEPFWMAKGRLIHSLFDTMLSSREESWDLIFQEGYQRALPSFMSVLPGSGISPDQKAFEEEARDHFNNLKSWLMDKCDNFCLMGVEEDRMSTRWGLKGRADAVLYNKSHRAILELKSGKKPVEDHGFQVSAYCLLFSMDAGKNSPDAYLFYSASGRVEELTDPGNGIERAILEGRNRIVALKHSYTLETESYAEYDCPRNGRCFSRAACTRFFADPDIEDGPLSSATARGYYSHWLRLLSRDAWMEEGDFARVLDVRSLKERTKEGITFPVMDVSFMAGCEPQTQATKKPGQRRHGRSRSEKTPECATSPMRDRSPGELVANVLLQDIVADVGPGEEVILHCGDPCGSAAMRGRVIDPEEGRTLVRLKVPFVPFSAGPTLSAEAPAFDKSQSWFLDRIPFSRGREVSRQALFRFLEKADPAVVAAVVSTRLSESPNTECSSGEQPSAPLNTGEGSAVKRESVQSPESGQDSEKLTLSELLQIQLNQDQESAVKAALNCETFHLIHGPPGTGKTRVLASLIRICLDRGERVLVACPTNVALDRLLVSVMDLGVKDFLRIGAASHLSNEFRTAVRKWKNQPVLPEELGALAGNFSDFRKLVDNTSLIGATAYQCAAHPFFLRQRFDRVVVDEAGQLDEPSTLAPLTYAPKFVLGGDHLQLPPVVKTRGQEQNWDEDGTLGQSLFERLFFSVPASQISCLRMQYRMNLEVQSICSQLFYGGTLFASPDVAHRRLKIDRHVSGDSTIEAIVAPEAPAVFVDVQGFDTGKTSSEEAEVVCEIVQRLIAAGVQSNEIGIITPYRAQQALIRKRLVDSLGGLRSISVDTVDRFQGGEREVIMLSLARSNAVTSFLADPKRLNVSLSRARSKLILLGRGRMLEEHPLFSSILDCVERITVNH
jgi:DNA replication ATP-dependent helicase Dna2